MVSRVLTIVGFVFLSSTLSAQDDAAAGDFVRLVDALDEPEYYCLDLAGWGDHLQLDDPLQTHTCKNRRAADQKFYFAEGRLRVAGFDRCVQIAGSSGVTLAGSAVIARACSDNALQKLSLDNEGHIRVADSGLCLGAGTDSTEASGPSHMWRTLTAVNCDSAPSNMVTWQVGVD